MTGKATGIIGAPDIDAGGIARWLGSFTALVARDRDVLTELDRVIGDADHGLNMARGMDAVQARLGEGNPDDATPGGLCREAAMTLISTVGGASGPLYGTFLLRLGAALGAGATVDARTFVGGLRAGLDGVRARGHAQVGDKTMLDAMAPAIAALEAAARHATDKPGWAAALVAAATAARAGSDATIPLVARKGRASYLGPRSAGHRDPGAASTALLFEALASELAPAPNAPDAT